MKAGFRFIDWIFKNFREPRTLSLSSAALNILPSKSNHSLQNSPLIATITLVSWQYQWCSFNRLATSDLKNVSCRKVVVGRVDNGVGADNHAITL